MSAWRKIAFACFVCSPAMLVVGGLATAIETQSGGSTSQHASPALQLAEEAVAPAAATPAPTAAADPGYTVSPEDAAKVEPEVANEEPPVFTEEYLNDPANIEAGKLVWETCAGCHGSRAYPGKAPKLKPKKYTPGLVFHQVTFGGKKMAPFGDVFTKEERMAVVAWVLSKSFAP